MTPAEHARLIDKQEFEAECRAIRERAYSYVERQREIEPARLANWLGKEVPPKSTSRPSPGRQPKLYTHEGVSKSLTEWALEIGVSRPTLANRIRSGMDFAQALTMKPGERVKGHGGRAPNKIHFKGMSHSVAEWAERLGIPSRTIRTRLSRGWPIERVLTTSPEKRRGVSADLVASMGTGGGSTAQETPEITFSEKAENS